MSLDYVGITVRYIKMNVLWIHLPLGWYNETSQHLQWDISLLTSHWWFSPSSQWIQTVLKYRSETAALQLDDTDELGVWNTAKMFLSIFISVICLAMPCFCTIKLCDSEEFIWLDKMWTSFKPGTSSKHSLLYFIAVS